MLISPKKLDATLTPQAWLRDGLNAINSDPNSSLHALGLHLSFMRSKQGLTPHLVLSLMCKVFEEGSDPYYEPTPPASLASLLNENQLAAFKSMTTSLPENFHFLGDVARAGESCVEALDDVLNQAAEVMDYINTHHFDINAILLPKGTLFYFPFAGDLIDFADNLIDSVGDAHRKTIENTLIHYTLPDNQTGHDRIALKENLDLACQAVIGLSYFFGKSLKLNTTTLIT